MNCNIYKTNNQLQLHKIVNCAIIALYGVMTFKTFNVILTSEAINVTYSEELININNKLCENDSMYSIVLLSAEALTITLSGYRCYLDGKYFICLNSADKLAIHSGRFEAENLSFQPYFYNVNLNHQIIGAIFYDEMREKYGYPDFRLFRMRDTDYFGIVHISDEEYNTAMLYYEQAKRNIAAHADDVMWSCRARADIISILRIAEAAYLGKKSGLENEVLRYIYDNINSEINIDVLCSRFNTNRTSLAQLIKEKTGLPPMKFILETRLVQSCPDLLFTNISINEIAEKYGFSNANYYIRSFKKRFGKSPLQYRKSGFEARIRDEEIYHRRAEKEITEMTVDEFIDYYNKGLGRAIIKLKQQKDKTPFKKPYIECIVQREHYGSDVYEKEILDVFDDESFTKEVEETLLNELSKNFTTWHIPLLILLGKRNELEEIIEHYYKSSYAELLEYTKKPWDGEEYPQCAKTFMSAASALGRYIKAGDKRIKEILFDIADLYEYTEFPVVPTFQNPLYQILDGVGREHFFMILDEVVKEHKHGNDIDIRKDIIIIPDDADPEDVIVPDLGEDFNLADTILNDKELKRENLDIWFKYKKDDKESVKRIAQAAIDETDLERKIYLLYFFCVSNGQYVLPEEFPLDVTPLVEWLEKEDYNISDTPPFGISENILQILEHKKLDIVRKIGLMMFYDERYAEGSARYYAISLRFGVNYNPDEDKADFIALLRSPNKTDREYAIRVLSRDLRIGVEGLPLEMLSHVYANYPTVWSRHDFCKLLVKKDIMPEDLKEECLYDYNKRTRELFLKNPKPKKKLFSMFGMPPKMPKDK